MIVSDYAGTLQLHLLGVGIKKQSAMKSGKIVGFLGLQRDSRTPRRSTNLGHQLYAEQTWPGHTTLCGLA